MFMAFHPVFGMAQYSPEQHHVKRSGLARSHLHIVNQKGEAAENCVDLFCTFQFFGTVYRIY
jgi:hypothetical protein